MVELEGKVVLLVLVVAEEVLSCCSSQGSSTTQARGSASANADRAWEAAGFIAAMQALWTPPNSREAQGLMYANRLFLLVAVGY